MRLPRPIAPVLGDGWTAELDLLNLPAMPAGRREFLHRVRQLNRERLDWSLAQKRAFNKIWSHLERVETSSSADACLGGERECGLNEYRYVHPRLAPSKVAGVAMKV